MYNFRSFFAGNHWWGKILGAFFGYLMARSTGAIIGILVGNFFDRALSEHLVKPNWQSYLEKNPYIQGIFLETTFSMFGHIAKVDGRVSEEEIRLAQKYMEAMRLSRKQKIQAEQYFRQGKRPTFNVETILIQFKTTFHTRPDLIYAFLDMQYSMAKIDGLDGKKIQALNTILVHFGVAPLNKQNRFYEQFEFGSSSRSHNHQHYSSTASASTGSLEQAHAILGTKPTSTQEEIKKAYRRLISQNHPDKLIAKGATETAIKTATNKTQAIRKAYEQICASRGW